MSSAASKTKDLVLANNQVLSEVAVAAEQTIVGLGVRIDGVGDKGLAQHVVVVALGAAAKAVGERVGALVHAEAAVNQNLSDLANNAANQGAVLGVQADNVRSINAHLEGVSGNVNVSAENIQKLDGRTTQIGAASELHSQQLEGADVRLGAHDNRREARQAVIDTLLKKVNGLCLLLTDILGDNNRVSVRLIN